MKSSKFNNYPLLAKCGFICTPNIALPCPLVYFEAIPLHHNIILSVFQCASLREKDSFLFPLFFR